jgi:hypothetical protein
VYLLVIAAVLISSDILCIFQDLLLPLLASDLTITYTDTAVAAVDRARLQSQDNVLLRHIGRMFPSANQLTTAGRVFAVMINTTEV